MLMFLFLRKIEFRHEVLRGVLLGPRLMVKSVNRLAWGSEPSMCDLAALQTPKSRQNVVTVRRRDDLGRASGLISPKCIRAKKRLRLEVRSRHSFHVIHAHELHDCVVMSITCRRDHPIHVHEVHECADDLDHDHDQKLGNGIKTSRSELSRISC